MYKFSHVHVFLVVFCSFLIRFELIYFLLGSLFGCTHYLFQYLTMTIICLLLLGCLFVCLHLLYFDSFSVYSRFVYLIFTHILLMIVSIVFGKFISVPCFEHILFLKIDVFCFRIILQLYPE